MGNGESDYNHIELKLTDCRGYPTEYGLLQPKTKSVKTVKWGDGEIINVTFGIRALYGMF